MYSGRAREMKATKAGAFRAGQMSATSKDNDSAEVKAARTSLLAKLGVTEDQGRLIQPEVSTRSLLFSSRRSHLTSEDYLKALPQIKKELVTTLEVVKPSNDWVQGEFQTRIVFKERADAKNALEAWTTGKRALPDSRATLGVVAGGKVPKPLRRRPCKPHSSYIFPNYDK